MASIARTGAGRWGTALFWAGCALISVGVLLHLPMYFHSLRGGHSMTAMPMDPAMGWGMSLVIAGVVATTVGALAGARRPAGGEAAARWEAPDGTRLAGPHVVMLLVLAVGLVIDTMKPATLGFVLPGLAREYGIPRETAALLPLAALAGTTVGSLVWGWLADRYGRRLSILLSTVLFVATSVCGAMPSFGLNLLMCFLMGASAGGMLPVVYALLAEMVPPRERSWLLVLVGGVGTVGGYLAASGAAALFEPAFGWRVLWLQGFPTGLLLLLLARYIPESPEFLLAQGRGEELRSLAERFNLKETARAVPVAASSRRDRGGRVTAALLLAALAWSLVNFGVLLWLPSDLQARGFSAALANGIIARSAILALPTVLLAAWGYSRWSSKGTLAASLLVTAAALGGALLLDERSASPAAVTAVVAALIVGSNAVIAVLLPYAAENYRSSVRGRGTGLVAGASKVGGVAVQGAALFGVVPAFGAAAGVLILPLAGAAALVAVAGPETRGRSLRELEAATG